MSPAPVRAPGRTRRLAAGLLLALGAAALAALVEQSPPASDTDARIEFYRKRLEGRGTYPSYARLGAAYLQKARETGNATYYSDAERYLVQSLNFQRNYEALGWLAVVYMDRHQFPEALAYAREAVETLPSDLDAQGTLFDIALALGQYPKAVAVAEGMLNMQPGFASWARMASLRHERGDLAGALDAMQRACADAEAQPLPAQTRAWCQVRLGSLLLARCDPQGAEAAYRRALGRLPNYFLAREHLAELRAAQEKLTEAVELYRHLLETNPSPRYRAALADLYDRTGESQQAAREREEVLAEVRRSAEGVSRADWRTLALLLLREPTTAEEGLRWAQKDLENRRDVRGLDTLAWAELQNNRPEEGQRWIRQALARNPKDPGILFHAAMIEWRLGHKAEAKGLLTQALSCPLALDPRERLQAEKALAELENAPT